MSNTKVITEKPANPSEDSSLVFDLPSPTDLPDSDVVIFDGHCRFCLAQVKRLFHFDGAERLSFISLHDRFVHESYPDLTHDELMKEIYVVCRQSGKRYAGANAFRYLSRRLPKLRWLAPVMHIPFTLPIWQYVYRFIAKRRYRISQRMASKCDDGNCAIHFDAAKKQ